MNDIQQQPRPVSLGRLAGSWLRESTRSRGLAKTFTKFCSNFGLFLRDSMPDRKKSRFGDIDYDCDFGVDTTWARLPLSVRLRELFTERLYQPTDPAEFHEVLKNVPVDFSRFVFIDLGSGKGRVLLLASEYPFWEILGVEVQPELHRIAQKNIERFDSPARQCKRISSICMDARDFVFPDEPIVLYLFNPFPDFVLEEVIENLRTSVERMPRPAYVIYNTPWERHIFDKAEFLVKYYETHQFQIYRSRG